MAITLDPYIGSPTTGQARIIKDGDTKTKFADVAGCDGAKTELMEAENSKSPKNQQSDEDKYDGLFFGISPGKGWVIHIYI